MKRRPPLLTAMPWILVGVALSIPLQIMVLYGHGPLELGDVFGKVTALNWLVISFCLVNAMATARASRWLLFTGPGLVVAVAVNNWLVGFLATDFSPMTAALATVGFLALQLPYFHPSIRRLLHQPAMRWWLQAARRKVRVPVYFGSSKTKLLHSETFDISESGAFIPCPLSHSTSQGLDPQARVNLSFALGVHRRIRCDGRIVRRVDAKGDYPSGIGIEFVNLTSAQRRELRRYLDQQPTALV